MQIEQQQQPRTPQVTELASALEPLFAGIISGRREGVICKLVEACKPLYNKHHMHMYKT